MLFISYKLADNKCFHWQSFHVTVAHNGQDFYIPSDTRYNPGFGAGTGYTFCVNHFQFLQLLLTSKSHFSSPARVHKWKAQKERLLQKVEHYLWFSSESACGTQIASFSNFLEMLFERWTWYIKFCAKFLVFWCGLNSVVFQKFFIQSESSSRVWLVGNVPTVILIFLTNNWHVLHNICIDCTNVFTTSVAVPRLSHTESNGNAFLKLKYSIGLNSEIHYK